MDTRITDARADELTRLGRVAEAQAQVASLKAQHTPGPWIASSHFQISDRAGYSIAEVYGREHIEADHRLIAAAPEMADALRAMFDERASKDPEAVVALCRAALEKAGLPV